MMDSLNVDVLFSAWSQQNECQQGYEKNILF